MQDKVFFDTNILIYCYSIDEKEKQEIALSLINNNAENSKISTQVINELSNIMATALENNCSVLYSEDMQHGFEIENTLTIINPFKEK